MNMNAYSPQIIVGACVIILVFMLAIAWAVKRQRDRKRTTELRGRFGPEYDAALVHYGSRRRSEAALAGRVRRVEQFNLRPLSVTERNRFLTEWDSIQGRFVDHPRGAVTEADELINRILQVKGYPGGTFQQRAADMSVHHPQMVDAHRRANAITVRAGRNEAPMEELRTAMILYRGVFEDLVQSKTLEMPRAQAA
jgi:hypothetical protein